MNILLTGSRGKIGTYLNEYLENQNHTVTGYDIRDGKDILNYDDLEKSFNHIDVVVHLAACMNFEEKQYSGIMEVNLQGLWNLLILSAKHQVKKVIFASSVDALGIFKGQAPPEYLPIDNNHPCCPGTGYGISKRLSEEMCRFWSHAEHIPVLSLRPPGVWFEETYDEISEMRKKDPKYEWHPYWEYGAFIDVRDLSALVGRIIEDTSVKNYRCYLVSSGDISTSGRTSRELSAQIHPGVPWVGDKSYEIDPYKTLLDIEPVKKAFGWEPEYSWRKYMKEKNNERVQ